MTLTEVIVELDKASLLSDITFPKSREAVRWGREFLLDLKDIQIAASDFLEQPTDLRRQLLSECLERLEARAAA